VQILFTSFLESVLDGSVAEYYRDGTARIEWGDGAFTGYINMADLSEYLGSE
jgi:hypothetical protein